MATLDNPVGRLLGILENAKSVGSTKPKTPSREIWMEVFNNQTSEVEDLLEA